ncbi:MAG TPA: formyltransferase family protein [Dysgonamonadaceae bacterium]|jgi:methionyl-tRNA formyltransferase|nr:formyltransferase family protein [Dysgonamonadaceae bacterium]
MIHSEKSNPQIIFAGENHGGKAALKSLQSTFDSIEVLSDDDNILKMMRNSDKRVLSFEECQASVGVCAAYRPLIGKDILSKKTIINTHPSLLPKYRGVHALAWAMLNLEEELGFSIHLMNEYVDDGDILEQFKVKYENQTAQEMLDLFNEYVENNLGRVVLDYMNNKITPIKQNRDEATWVTKRNLTDCVIDFDESFKKIEALFRVLAPPYPYPMLKIKDELFEVLTHELIPRKYDMHNGRVVNIEDDNVYIKIRDGLLVTDKLRNYGTQEEYAASKILKRGQRLYQICKKRF